MSVRVPLSLLLSLVSLGCASDSKDPGTSDVAQQTGTAVGNPSVGYTADGSVVLGLPSGVSVSTSPKDAGPVGIDASITSPLPGDSGTDAAATAAYACTQNSDCVVKDVGSCCGYYPGCANLGATFTAPNCSNGQVGTCSFPIIDHCECQQNTCVAVQSALQPSQQF